MGLNLIRRGPETIRLNVAPGDGRVNAYKGNNLYPLQRWNSWVFVTVTATGVTGISVQDRENGYDREERTDSGPVMSYSGVFYANKFGPTVAVFDPSENTEIIMNAIPIPPPYFVRLLQRLWGGCRGAKANRSALYPQGVHRAREGRECQSDRLGKFLSGAFARASQDHRRGHGKRFGARRNVDFLNDTVPIAGAQRARLNGVGSDCSKGAGSLSECMARQARRCAGSGRALSRTLSTAGVGA